ncbi:Dipeptide transport system permease protein DppB [Rhodobacteraceae bacterium SB2]|jgi:peptide/nickel transport system permease protein|nr:ABC transporter permease [Marinovum sp.]MBT3649493.1 ABC transporter permease [Paracoccaceae bacterium]MDA9854258.1 ABC transporter permease [bacterium]OAH06305.1 Dipeptide transport system permease protein DppB [Rhodobacteraceae bacterium SB2]WQC62759.1 ABC transporter permease [Alphaproteobacteria bacterium US3C007]|tara:strand:- start:1322 stop:2305 length:984 start_codon:yes stop_codon:yes gene_type:complete
MVLILLRRLGQAVLVLFIVALISFLIFRYVGSPVDNLLAQEATVQQRADLEEALGLNDPVYVQYFGFVWKALQFDFGNSYRGALPVAELISSRLPATLELAFTSALFALILGVITGIYTAIRRGGLFANVILSLSLIGVSLPTFLIGVLLIWVFAVELQWLPSFGRGEVVELGWWSTGFLTLSGLKSLILPSITLGLYQLTLIMRLTRSEMLEVLRQDYVRFARALGLSERSVNFRHALPNTLIPVTTIAGLQLGSIVAFAIITETVFQWPGVGLLFINAVYFVDIPVMSAYLLLVGVLFVLINLAVDLLYLAIDPRLRDSQLSGEA